MKRIIRICVVIISIAYSCKEGKPLNDAKENNTIVTETNIESQKDKLQVFFDAIIKNDAQITLYYQDGEVLKTIAGNAVKGKPSKTQRVSFVFPQKIIPNGFYLRFDAANTINLEKIVLNMNDDRIIIKDSAFFEYFKYNKTTLKVSENLLTLTQPDTLKTSESLVSRITNRYSKYM
ncbi:hypothetical protein SAMN04515667_0550 [Formosa sp. Hel1_31_208]|uniref:hypothetical protein n=1 Tax=Formosa sp. Hel1_31_208 TaxID=1798225 RepID=UPI00087DD817|nr:hypothetical protein [Formosa sp. Hel1_31_208]SDR75263.1 hypothetical protein SAMN04515667_0550 [Formosa sp. Hel1_31_208]